MKHKRWENDKTADEISTSLQSRVGCSEEVNDRMSMLGRVPNGTLKGKEKDCIMTCSDCLRGENPF